MRRVLYVFLAVLGIVFESRAQDPQFSQFYAAPLYINPAFTGASTFTRVGANYRNQWPSLDASFVTFSVYADHFIEKYNSGIGMIITTDQEGLAGLKSTSIGLSYAYQLKLNDNIVFRPGFQMSYTSRNVNFTDLVWGSQLDPVTGFDPNLPPDPTLTPGGSSVSYVDMTVGGILYSKSLFIGVTAAHLNEPNQSLIDENSPLPMKISVHGGYKFMLKSRTLRRDLTYTYKERSFTPVFQYKSQGPFQILDVGGYLHLEPINFGFWYRGFPLKGLETLSGTQFPQNAALVFSVGITTNDMNIGYSYDYTISDLSVASGGAHEFSISYFFKLGTPSRVPRDRWKIPCPKN